MGLAGGRRCVAMFLKSKYDLTNKKELEKIIELFPWYAIVKYVVDKVFSSDTAKTQKKIAEKLIEKGKEQGVDEMEIILDNTRGFKMNSPVDDVDANIMVGEDGKLHIKVKYR